MLRIKICISSSIFFFLIFIHPAFSQSDPSQENQDEKTAAVNQELDVFEGSQIITGSVAKGVSNPQPDAQKEFSGIQPDAGEVSPNALPDRANAGAMFKSLVSPDLIKTNQSKAPSSVMTRTHTFDTGAEIFYYRYKEPSYLTILNTTSPIVTNTGPMYGFFADYAYRPADPNFFNNFLTSAYLLQFRYADSNDLEYKGSGIIKDKHDHAFEIRGLIGKDYYIGANSRVTPYFGFGYRYLFDKGDGEISSTGANGYDRKSHYSYLPLGADALVDMPHDWAVDFNAEYDILLQGWQKSYFSDLDQSTGFNVSDLTNTQSHGFGVRASIKFIKKGPGIDFYVEPYIRFWNIDFSKAENLMADGMPIEALVEPRNSTTEVGSKFGIQF